MLAIPEELARILEGTPELGHAYLVGGCVRDALLGRKVEDYDIEVFGQSYEALVPALRRWGSTDVVGRSFGVVKLALSGGRTYDFALPRRDSKVAPGHKGFAIGCDPQLSLKDAAGRRDFSVNALMFDPRRREVLDFFGGRADLEQRILRHTTEAFVEDPLRVLRGMQLAARLDFEMAPETVALCRAMKGGHGELALERVREEWMKWAAGSLRPSRGLRLLVATEWVEHYPEIRALENTPQDPEWHPEGDVFVHTCLCCDAMARLPDWLKLDKVSRGVYMLATLAHDFGKPSTTHVAERHGRSRIVSPGHEEAGKPLAARFLERIRMPAAIVERVIPLVANHLAHLQQASDRGVRRLARRLAPETIQGLCLVMTADSMGRLAQAGPVPESIAALEAKAQALAVVDRAPKPILRGRDLLDAGMQPGPVFKMILDAAYEAQLEGTFQDRARGLQWLANQEALPLTQEARDTLHRQWEAS